MLVRQQVSCAPLLLYKILSLLLPQVVKEANACSPAAEHSPAICRDGGFPVAISKERCSLGIAKDIAVATGQAGAWLTRLGMWTHMQLGEVFRDRAVTHLWMVTSALQNWHYRKLLARLLMILAGQLAPAKVREGTQH